MLTVYQPQVESWQGNQLSFRAAVAAKAQGANTETFGVIWGSARTEVDRVARQVTLEELRLTRSNFPTLPDNGAAYLSELQQPFQGAARTIALDRLEASLAASGTAPPGGVPVQNDPPQILVSHSPALLVLIDLHTEEGPVGRSYLAAWRRGAAHSRVQQPGDARTR